MKDENEEEKKSVDCATEGEDLLRGRHQGCRAVREGNGKKMKTVWLEGRTSRGENMHTVKKTSMVLYE